MPEPVSRLLASGHNHDDLDDKNISEVGSDPGRWERQLIASLLSGLDVSEYLCLESHKKNCDHRLQESKSRTGEAWGHS